MSRPDMPAAAAGQKLLIDARRHPVECAHPRADEFTALTFLSCKRCGTEFVDGQLHVQPPVLRSSDPPGVEQASSYGGELAEDVAEALVARIEANAPAC